MADSSISSASGISSGGFSPNGISSSGGAQDGNRAAFQQMRQRVDNALQQAGVDPQQFHQLVHQFSQQNGGDHKSAFKQAIASLPSQAQQAVQSILPPQNGSSGSGSVQTTDGTSGGSNPFGFGQTSSSSGNSDGSSSIGVINGISPSQSSFSA